MHLQCIGRRFDPGLLHQNLCYNSIEVNMSATTEILLEQIRATEEAIAAAQSIGDGASLVVLRKKLIELHGQFNASSSALNEGKGVLKG